MVKRHLATIPAAGALLCLALGLAGCASEGPKTANAPAVETAFVPDPNDPLGRWAHLIREASDRYDMPEKWIRAVMMRESNGRATAASGKPLTSSAGAIGLMQVMPGTYDLMRWQYGLGANPADPHDNIMAGTAYLREMYDLFGAPGFLAAYNCGPACYAGHLAGKKTLPRETRQYVAALTPVLRGSAPREASQSAGASAIEIAVVPNDAPKPGRTAGEVVVAFAPESPKAPEPLTVAGLPAAPLTVEPKRMDPKPTAVPASPPVAAPVVVARAEPVQVLPPRSAPVAERTAKPTLGARPGQPALRSVETQVAEALLSPQAVSSGQRVVIRFVSQRANGCGSLKGKDTVCVAMAAGGM